MLLKLAFNESPLGRFLVTTAMPSRRGSQSEGEYTFATFEDEDAFLELLVAADLDYDAMTCAAAAVLRTIHRASFPQEWIELELTTQQCTTLSLVVSADSEFAPHREGKSTLSRLSLQLGGDTTLEEFLLQAPTPFVMLAGPEHIFTFINMPYVRILGRLKARELLGKPVRQALPEMEGQPFFKLLDDVYRTGNPFVGVEVRGNLRYEDGVYRDVYFDFIYHPVRNRHGEIVGVMANATDVTERVLSRLVSESREAKLYRQWAELDAIYRNSPVAMALVDADAFTILRSNDRQAALSGRTHEQMIGRGVFEVYPGFPELLEIYQEVKRGISVMDREMVGEVPSSPGVIRRWISNFSPIFSADGICVVAIACAAFEPRQSLNDQVTATKVIVGSD